MRYRPATDLPGPGWCESVGSRKSLLCPLFPAQLRALFLSAGCACTCTHIESDKNNRGFNPNDNLLREGFGVFQEKFTRIHQPPEPYVACWSRTLMNHEGGGLYFGGGFLWSFILAKHGPPGNLSFRLGFAELSGDNLLGGVDILTREASRCP